MIAVRYIGNGNVRFGDRLLAYGDTITAPLGVLLDLANRDDFEPVTDEESESSNGD